MIAFYDNALPIAYTTMRQHARRAKHMTLLAHHMDMMSQVRAEVYSWAPRLLPPTPSPPDELIGDVGREEHEPRREIAVKSMRSPLKVGTRLPSSPAELTRESMAKIHRRVSYASSSSPSGSENAGR
jgi:hypothetical protein